MRRRRCARCRRLWRLAAARRGRGAGTGGRCAGLSCGRALRMTGVGEGLPRSRIRCRRPRWCWSIPASPCRRRRSSRALTGATTRRCRRRAAACATLPTLAAFLRETRNDLEAPAHRLAPVIAQVKAALAAQPGCLLARMSGSGATCFGLFADPRRQRRRRRLRAARAGLVGRRRDRLRGLADPRHHVVGQVVQHVAQRMRGQAAPAPPAPARPRPAPRPAPPPSRRAAP